MKTILSSLSLLLITFGLGAQQPRWLAHKDISYLEYIYKTTYVPSSTSPFIVNFLEEQPQNVPNGPVNDPIPHLTVYDTSGVELWTKEFRGRQNGFEYWVGPLSILTKEDDKFWTVLNPTFDTVKIGSQVLHSAYHDSLYYSYFFIEMDKSGTILSYFTVPFKNNTSLRFVKGIFDINGDFVFGGLAEGEYNQVVGPLYPVPFSFGNYSTTIQPGESVHCVAKISASGTPAGFFNFRSRNFIGGAISTSYSHILELGLNTLDGNIVFAGMLGDTLTIASNTMINTTLTNQLFLGMLDANLNYLGSKSETVATSGTYLTAMAFNPAVNAFYFTGSWDGFLSYGQSPPVAGSTFSLGNDSYVAKLQSNSLNVDVTIPVMPVPNTGPPLAMVYGIDFSNDGSVYFVGAGDDSLMQFGSTVFQTGTHNWLGFMVKTQANLQVDTALFMTGTFNGRFTCIDIGNNNVYTGGGYNGTYGIGNLGFTSVIQADAALLRFDVKSKPGSGFLLSNTAICRGGVVSCTNISWGQPAPSFSWSANPPGGVTFSPGSSHATPTISFANAGNYTITCVATNSLGSGSSSKQQVVLACTGIDKINAGALLSVQPNPSDGIFKIKSPFQPAEKMKLCVLNATGQVVLSREVRPAEDGTVFLDLTSCADGFYFVQVEHGEALVTKKIMVAK